jgi:hypothetical protein
MWKGNGCRGELILFSPVRVFVVSCARAGCAAADYRDSAQSGSMVILVCWRNAGCLKSLRSATSASSWEFSNGLLLTAWADPGFRRHGEGDVLLRVRTSHGGFCDFNCKKRMEWRKKAPSR